jgi:hypothetical protein
MSVRDNQPDTALPAVQVRTSPVQSTQFQTEIGPVDNVCALVRHQSGLVWTAESSSVIITPFRSPSGSVCRLIGAAVKFVMSLLTRTFSIV